MSTDTTFTPVLAKKPANSTCEQQKDLLLPREKEGRLMISCPCPCWDSFSLATFNTLLISLTSLEDSFLISRLSWDSFFSFSFFTGDFFSLSLLSAGGGASIFAAGAACLRFGLMIKALEESAPMRETVMALACKRVSTRGGGLLGLREVWSLCREKWFEILWAEGSERAEVEEGVEEDLGCFLRVGSMDVLGSEASKMHLWVGWRGILWINEGKWWKPGCLGGV